MKAANDIIKLIEESAISKAPEITFLIGTKQHFTEPEAIRVLLAYKKRKINPYINFKILLPEENEFHIKCYIFENKTAKKALVGSANLTSNGLDCNGELMIETNDMKAIGEISSYISCFLQNSVEWKDYIEEYGQSYKKFKPMPENINHFEIKKNIVPKDKNVSNKLKSVKIPAFIPARNEKPREHIAPTVDFLHTITDIEVLERKDKLYDKLKKQGKHINRDSYILLNGNQKTNLDKYQEGYSIDRTMDAEQNGWKIGDIRAICIIGAVGETNYHEVVVFTKPDGRTDYRVNDKILEKAKQLGIIDNTPTQENLEKYKNFIIKNKPKSF